MIGSRELEKLQAEVEGLQTFDLPANFYDEPEPINTLGAPFVSELSKEKNKQITSLKNQIADDYRGLLGVRSKIDFDVLLAELDQYSMISEGMPIPEHLTFKDSLEKLSKLKTDLAAYQQAREECIQNFQRVPGETDRLQKQTSGLEERVKNELETRTFFLSVAEDELAEEELLGFTVQELQDSLKSIKQKSEELSKNYGVSPQLETSIKQIQVLEERLQSAESAARAKLEAAEIARCAKETSKVTDSIEMDKMGSQELQKSTQADITLQRKIEATTEYKGYMKGKINEILLRLENVKVNKQPEWFKELKKVNNPTVADTLFTLFNNNNPASDPQRKVVLDNKDIPSKVRYGLEKYQLLSKLEKSKSVDEFHSILLEKKNKKTITRHRDEGFRRFARKAAVRFLGYGILGPLAGVFTFFANRTRGTQFFNKVTKEEKNKDAPAPRQQSPR